MCGISGYLGSGTYYQAIEVLKKMGRAIAHRGPDDSGEWFDSNQGIGLSHRRLSIVDLSPAGHQPMISASGRYVFAFNGEIYNHLFLRKSLEEGGLAPNWQGHSDTETLLAGFDVWGIQDTVIRAVGMFAFAVWDRSTCTLTLGRDRLGEKPLFYGWQGDTFLFGSELKALRVHPAFNAEVDRNSLALLMRHNCIPSPYSIYQGISKLQPGNLLTVSLQQRDLHVVPYWSGNHIVEAGLAKPFAGSAAEAVDALEDLLKNAIGLQMVADVPLGAFLSGGVDSSTIVALMQAQSSRPVRTFSIGFHDDLYDEARYAKAVALHLRTDHTEWYVTAKDALDVIPQLPRLYDEPFADSSQIPTHLVSHMARQHVTVSLSGDAGDELFGGYNRYVITSRLWSRLSHLPVEARCMLSAAITSVSPQKWNAMAKTILSVLPKKAGMANWGDSLHKGAGVMASRSVSELYRGLVSHWPDPSAIVLGSTEPATVITDIARQPLVHCDVERMMALDMLSYLPDDILTKVDRAAMGVSLETRVPFLDHRVVEFAWRLPLEYKLRDGVGKWVLRQLLYKYVPKELIERPKQGFGIPIDSWLRGPLRDWAEDLLSESRLRQEGYFNPAPIRQKWTEHLSGKFNWQYHLWDVLMFQAWLDEEKGCSGV
ncbi:asparagine synthase (glutamine-hydrolyzing) [Pelotalea chapellei]|uniref:asparagine synthase (glutamine-hydrolyzing) n=1 Tax=Pelotalea chapellei TaxID=44671 RepID=A0ABS5U4M7_9BACT|nr:asparagine synthase (glutamine-hydrolyzing) [Pelotalea chapellei]MBT1070604.1 asparagine synthase (glutamine-hydrolyzing) [Pelotalea chapellei]